MSDTYAIGNAENACAIRAAFDKVINFSNYNDFKSQHFTCLTSGPRKKIVNGTTGFFRHIALFRSLIETFNAKVQQQGRITPIRILAAPSSIGCEAYGLAAMCPDFEVDAFDRLDEFTTLARLGVYPIEMAWHMSADLKDILFDESKIANGLIPIREDVKARVRFLDAQPLQTFAPDRHYNLVMANNLFVYLNRKQKADVFSSLGRINPHVIIISISDSGHPKRIPHNLPYISVKDHAAWKDLPLAQNTELLNYHRLVRYEL